MKKYQVIWKGPVHRTSGTGTASREYALALRRQGIDVKVVLPHRKQSHSGHSVWMRKLRSLGKTPLSGKRRKVLIYHGKPHGLNVKIARKRFDRILLNTVWETTKVPRNWFPDINRYDGVCVPSRQNLAALRKSGVNAPIYLVPHGVNTTSFTPRNKKLSLGIPKGTFVFVSVFTFQHRKNPETLLRAFWEEFSCKDRVALVIKTSGFGARETGRWIKNRIHAYKKKRAPGRKTAPLYVIAGRSSPESLKRIYTTGHAFVLPTRGEGVGLPFLEALASGLPVIATGWGGHMDFLNKRNSFLVKYRLEPPAKRMNRGISRSFRYLFAQRGQRWAEPRLDSLKRQMRYAYEHPQLCRKKGRRGRKDVRKLSWNRAGAAMKRAVEKVLSHQSRG